MFTKLDKYSRRHYAVKRLEKVTLCGEKRLEKVTLCGEKRLEKVTLCGIIKVLYNCGGIYNAQKKSI